MFIGVKFISVRVALIRYRQKIIFIHANTCTPNEDALKSVMKSKEHGTCIGATHGQRSSKSFMRPRLNPGNPARVRMRRGRAFQQNVELS